MKTLLKSYRPHIVYSLLASSILLPLFWTGYILTLDMIFTPMIRMPAAVTSSYLLNAVLHVLNFVLASWVIEKVLLFGILVGAGIGMHKLVERVLKEKGGAAAYFAGVLFMVNPFTYDRFMAGQYNVLLGYALLPWFARAFLRFLDEPGWRTSIVLAAFATMIGIVSIHTLGLVAILVVAGVGFTVFSIARSNQRRLEAKGKKRSAVGTHKGLDSSLRWNDSGGIGRLVKFGLVSLGVFVFASCYWLVPAVMGHGNTAAAVEHFGEGDRAAFATLGAGFAGKVWHVLQLQGFWAEGHGLYRLPQERVPVWGLVVAVLWVLVGFGVVKAWKDGLKRIVILFGGSAIVAVLLAASSLNGWLSGWLPFFAGFREPQKFVGLVALAMALFGGLGLAALLERMPKQADYVKLGAVLLIVLITPTMFWGFARQLRRVQYPASWFSLNKQLDADKSDFKVLFLPWHEYMYFNFAGRIIANPASKFYDKPVLSSDNPEFGGATSYVPDPVKTRLSDSILPGAAHGQQVGKQLAAVGIKYVILSKDSDYESYGYIQKQADLKLLRNNSDMQVYQNLAYK